MTDILNAFVLLANFVVIPGLAYGSQLALGALGVTMVYSVLRFSNFAHGELMSFGAMICVLLTWGMKSAGISFGIFPYRTAGAANSDYRHYRVGSGHRQAGLFLLSAQAFRDSYLSDCIGWGNVFTGGLIRFIIGPDDRVFTDGERFLLKARTFKEVTGLSEGLAIKTSQGVTIVLAFIVVALLFWFLNRTKTGKSMRAYSDNEDLALLSGINPERVVMITWMITGVLAALAGTLYGLDKSYKPFTYLSLLLPIFASAIVGGVGSPIGAIAGGYVIAFSELLVTFAYKKVISYLTLSGWYQKG